jgi:hypothetical protein
MIRTEISTKITLTRELEDVFAALAKMYFWVSVTAPEKSWGAWVELWGRHGILEIVT